MEFDVTFDQSVFHREKETVDWGVLVSEWQGAASVCVVALDPDQAAEMLRGAASAIEEDAAKKADAREGRPCG